MDSGALVTPQLQDREHIFFPLVQQGPVRPLVVLESILGEHGSPRTIMSWGVDTY